LARDIVVVALELNLVELAKKLLGGKICAGSSDIVAFKISLEYGFKVTFKPSESVDCVSLVGVG
jgi:hypothetical protein